MYARLVRFTFGPGKRSEAQAIADEIAPLIASQPGCESVGNVTGMPETRLYEVLS